MLYHFNRYAQTVCNLGVAFAVQKSVQNVKVKGGQSAKIYHNMTPPLFVLHKNCISVCITLFTATAIQEYNITKYTKLNTHILNTVNHHI